MAYNKTNWQNGITWVDAEKLNHMEDGIEGIDLVNGDNTAKLTQLEAQLTALETQEVNNATLLETLQNTVNAMQATTDAISSLVGANNG